MNACGGGPGGVPAGEQLLWRGAPDPGRVVRRTLRAAAAAATRQVVGGTERTGQSAMPPWAVVARYAPGDPLEIVYDPADPSVSTVAGPGDG